ncbi:uncharacterized protein VTP21DRAFT_4721 [Calcarisporiella thermophila]|uniref:uncharacterized protein n=1 Tax=Calcarisporiella thermophila TaxID=911321 RepID=UPI00374377D3
MQALLYFLFLISPLIALANPLSNVLRTISADPDHQILSDTQLQAAKQYAKLMAAAICGPGQIGAFVCDAYCNEFPNTTAIQYFDVSPYDINGYVARDDKLPYSFNDPSKGRVHQGFLNSYRSVAREILSSVTKQVETYPDYEVEVIGHSLGGALASLHAMDLWETNKIPKEKLVLVTVGEPRVGDARFAARVDRAGILAKCLVSKRDIVAHIPPRLFGYKHHSSEIHTDSRITKQCRDPEDYACAYGEPGLTVIDHLVYIDVNMIQCAGDFIIQQLNDWFGGLSPQLLRSI